MTPVDVPSFLSPAELLDALLSIRQAAVDAEVRDAEALAASLHLVSRGQDAVPEVLRLRPTLIGLKKDLDVLGHVGLGVDDRRGTGTPE